MNRIWKYKNLYILLVLLICSTSSQGADDGQLRSALAQIGDADGYSYDITILSWLPGKKLPDTIQMSNYQSRTEGIVFARSGQDLFFLCSRGQFRVDAASKTVYYHPINDSAELAELRRDWDDSRRSGLVDSFFLTEAHTRSRKKEGKKIRYELQYAENRVIREASFRYDTEQQFFDQITYAMERELAVRGTGAATIRQRVTMGNYRKRRPQELSGILQQQQQLKAYIEQTYKDYTIQTF